MSDLQNVKFKVCSKCNLVKDINEFHKNKGRCIKCVKSSVKKVNCIECNKLIYEHGYQAHLSTRLHKKNVILYNYLNQIESSAFNTSCTKSMIKV